MACLLALAASAIARQAAAQDSAATDRAALVELYNATDGANWRNKSNWLSTRPLGEWYGVTADGGGRVVGLDLSWGGLTGPLPQEIGNLSRLRTLILGDNFHLSGSLPPEVGNVRRLSLLDVGSTDLTGPLPASVGNLSELGWLGLSWSRMRGPLPQSLTKLSKLEGLGLWETFLCAPANAAFQTWLAGVSEASGIHTCKPATVEVAPMELGLRGSATRSITVTQTGGGAPVSWTAVGTEPWLRVTPAAGIGTARVTVGADPAMLQAVERAATGAVVVTADGANVRVPVTATRAAAAAGLPRPAGGMAVLDGSSARGRTGPSGVRGTPERTMWRFRRGAGDLPDDHPAHPGSRHETRDTAAGDRAALTALYDATAGGDWWRNTHWLSDRPLGEWYGVTTDTDGRVTALELSDNRLTGAMPTAPGSLTHLESLDLSRNALTGSIPAVLGEPASLRRLNLGFNGLTGAIPPALGRLSNLESLNLRWNEFRTPIPSELGNLTSLRELNFEYALVTGRIPPALGDLTNLRQLDLCDNFGLTGSIPSALGNLVDLEYLCLGGNELTGPIPAVLGRLTKLRDLVLLNNSLTGPIPSELGDLAELRYLNLHNNRLEGEIPPELGNLTNLITLWLHENALTGPIPASLGRTALFELYLYGNELTGPIPTEFGNLENLEVLHLQDNALSGVIPSTLGELANLQVLDLRNNALTGEIPAALGRLSNLEVLDLSDNELTGPIPSGPGVHEGLHGYRLLLAGLLPAFRPVGGHPLGYRRSVDPHRRLLTHSARRPRRPQVGPQASGRQRSTWRLRSGPAYIVPARPLLRIAPIPVSC